MRLLIVGNLDGQVGAASKIARDRGAKVTLVETMEMALENLRAGRGADLLMVDVDCEISRLVSSLHAERINTPVVACGTEADSKKAVAAIKAGAKEYIPLPPDEEMIAAILEAITDENSTLISKSPKMQAVVEMAEKIAPSDASVLITGESGSGKEVMARFIHMKSKRATKPIISVNCAAIPDNLLESELFGHEKGAFTGALARRVGKFEEADGGTLFLDEISEMDVRLQAKLLRAIQEKEIDRVGGTKPVKVDIRILATSNRNLEEEVKAGKFREDLFFRLNVINIPLPPLRERVEEIAPLAEIFIQRYSKSNGLPPRPLSEGALAKMKAYHWQGNVRELENICHRAVLMASGNRIEADAVMIPDLTAGKERESPIPTKASSKAATEPAATGYSDPLASMDDASKALIGRTVESVERDLILGTLGHCLGNRTHAANILGISIRTLRNKLKQYGDEGVPVPPAAHEEAG